MHFLYTLWPKETMEKAGDLRRGESSLSSIVVAIGNLGGSIWDIDFDGLVVFQSPTNPVRR